MAKLWIIAFSILCITLVSCDHSDTIIMYIDNQTEESISMSYFIAGEEAETYKLPPNSKTQIYESSGMSPKIQTWEYYSICLL